MSAEKTPVLSGLKVLDIGQYVAGPYTAKILADNGAEVIKVEPPGKGDVARGFGPFPGDKPDPEKSGLFLVLNTSKKGITLDITKPEGKELFLELVKKADAVVENYKPGYLPALGLGYADLARVNPKLVMTSISDYGQSGPYRDYEATEICFEAAGSLMIISGELAREPLKSGIQLAQYLSGLTGFTGTVAALYHAGNTGEGQQADIAIYDAVPTNINGRSYTWAMDVSTPLRQRSGERFGPMYGIYGCADGYIGCGINDYSEVDKLADLISPELKNREMFGDLFWGSTAHPTELDSILVPWFFEHTKVEIMTETQKRGVAFSYVATPKDVLENNPQLKFRSSLIELEHPRAGKHPYYRPSPRFSHSSYRMFPAPLLGQHNEEVFSGWLGLKKDDLVRLVKEGVV